MHSWHTNCAPSSDGKDGGLGLHCYKRMWLQMGSFKHYLFVLHSGHREELPVVFFYSKPKLERAREMLTQRKTSCIFQMPKWRYQNFKYLSVIVCPLSTLVYLIFFF